MPSSQNAGSMRSVDSFYMPDEDNVYNIELRELLSRKMILITTGLFIFYQNLMLKRFNWFLNVVGGVSLICFKVASVRV